jgi:Asp-tRNA(Asn)/Glu-tRNA(Gln) amidotransferase A subunit family amidase
VATAAGLAFGTIGSDTGGSIRFPASANGVTGLKPTWGPVSRYGVFPLAPSFDHIGPMTRSAADAGAMLGVIAGRDPNDPTTLAAPVPDYLADLEATALSTRDGGGNGFVRLHEAYRASRANYTGKVIVPVLWDRTSRRIVSNESIEIAEMLNHAFDEMGGDEHVDLYPAALRSGIDALSSRITRSLATGVYAVAAARDQAEYDSATDELFSWTSARCSSPTGAASSWVTS